MNGIMVNYSGAYCVSPSPYENSFCPYNLRKMSQYMLEKKKNFFDLTENEKELFQAKE